MNPKKISVLVEAPGLKEVQEFTVETGQKLRELAAEVAKKCGFPPEEALVFVEDGDEALDLDLIVDEGYPHGRVHHVHHKKEIEVIVFYESKEKKKSLSPAARVARVLAWAVSRDGFNIDPAIAPEMHLQLVGHREFLPLDAHIGRYVDHHQHVLKLNLVRGIIPNG